MTALRTAGDARTLADQYWARYGNQMLANLGCSG
jgi:hypothetical protein